MLAISIIGAIDGARALIVSHQFIRYLYIYCHWHLQFKETLEFEEW